MCLALHSMSHSNREVFFVLQQGRKIKMILSGSIDAARHTHVFRACVLRNETGSRDKAHTVNIFDTCDSAHNCFNAYNVQLCTQQGQSISTRGLQIFAHTINEMQRSYKSNMSKRQKTCLLEIQ